MNPPTCMYKTEKPGILYSSELLKAVDHALSETGDEIPQKLINMLLDAMEISSYSEYLRDKYNFENDPLVYRERHEDFANESHEFYLGVRTRVMASARVTKTEKQAKKERERQAYTQRRNQATIPGYDAEIEAIYAMKRTIQNNTGEKHHVDHIIPLCGMWNGVQVVCGFHAPWNLRPLRESENVSKGCRHDPNADHADALAYPDYQYPRTK